MTRVQRTRDNCDVTHIVMHTHHCDVITRDPLPKKSPVRSWASNRRRWAEGVAVVGWAWPAGSRAELLLDVLQLGEVAAGAEQLPAEESRDGESGT